MAPAFLIASQVILFPLASSPNITIRDAAKAFGVFPQEVSRLINPVPQLATPQVREAFEARNAPPKRRKRATKAKAGAAPPKKAKKRVEGARQKQNGKWSCPRLFPGQEFDDFDAFRAAKKQHVEQRAAYSDQLHAFRGPLRGRRR